MSKYPTITDIELRWRATSSGVCVIVEGETELDDAWFYNRWFGNLAREITFFPQNGWEQVVDAVVALRITLGDQTVYGIVDRDFEETLSYDPFPLSGILHTRRYTLENYLLDPNCWFDLVQPFTTRRPKPGWATRDEARLTLRGLYRECLPLSAYNWTLRHARRAREAAFRTLPKAVQSYREHPKSLVGIDVLGNLRLVQAHVGIAEDLGQIYTMRLAVLETFSDDQLADVVSGKYVHKLLRERIPLGMSGKEDWDNVVGAYLDRCPDPPGDLIEIVERILSQAQATASLGTMPPT